MIMFISLVSGCWSSAEMDELAFVMGIAVDQNTGKEKYKVTVQIANPGESKGSQSEESSSGGGIGYINYTESGIGIQSAISKLFAHVDRRLYTGHDQAIVIGYDVAENDISSILDALIRSSDGRFTILLFIAEGSAEEVLGIESDMERIPIVNLKNMIESQENYGSIVSADIRSFLTDTLCETKASAIPLIGTVINSQGKEEAVIDRMAVFKNGAICTTLSSKECQSMCIVQGKGKNGFIEIDYEGSYVELKINSSKSKITPEFNDSGLEKIIVKIDIGSSVIDTDADLDILSVDVRDQIAAVAEAELLTQMKNTLEHTQDYGADIFGFGEKLKAYHPRKSKDFISDWDKVYSELNVEFDICFDILSSGSILRPPGPNSIDGE